MAHIHKNQWLDKDKAKQQQRQHTQNRATIDEKKRERKKLIYWYGMDRRGIVVKIGSTVYVTQINSDCII